MHQTRSSACGTGCLSRSSAYWMHRVMPGLGLVSVPSRSKNAVCILDLMNGQMPLIKKPPLILRDHRLALQLGGGGDFRRHGGLLLLVEFAHEGLARSAIFEFPE